MTKNGKQIRVVTEMVIFHFKVPAGLPPVTRVHKNGRSHCSLGFEDGIYRIKLYILMQTSIISPHRVHYKILVHRIKTRIIGKRNTVSA